MVKSKYPNKSFQDIKEDGTGIWMDLLSLEEYKNVHNYGDVKDVPGYLMKRYSASQFHSMWLTYGFGIGKSETFVDLPIKDMTDF